MRFISLLCIQVRILSSAIKATAEIFQQRHSNLAPPTCELRALLRASRNKNNAKTCRTTPDANKRAVEIAGGISTAQLKQSNQPQLTNSTRFFTVATIFQRMLFCADLP